MSTHANNVANAVSGTPGTGTITLGSAVTGSQSFSAAYGANATVDVFITDGTAWEVARNCTYTHSGTTLTRGTLEASSTGSAISLTSAAVVRVAATADWGNRLEMQLDRAQTTITADGSTTQTTTAGATNIITTALSSVVANPKGWWNTGTKLFQPTRAGAYLVFANIQRNSGAGSVNQAGISKNGTSIFSGAVSDAAWAADTVSGIAELNGSSDYLQLTWYTSVSCTTVATASAVAISFTFLG